MPRLAVSPIMIVSLAWLLALRPFQAASTRLRYSVGWTSSVRWWGSDRYQGTSHESSFGSFQTPQ
jgi:hypothetical protein